jgi:hypothetical protein
MISVSKGMFGWRVEGDGAVLFLKCECLVRGWRRMERFQNQKILPIFRFAPL